MSHARWILLPLSVLSDNQVMMNPDFTTKIRSSIPQLILASGSPRRRALLSELAVPFQVVVSDIAETIAADLGPEAQAAALAERKARAGATSCGTGIVLGADTIVVLDGKLLGKPEDDEDAAGMLRFLSGREH